MSPGASQDGSSIIGYTADETSLYGSIGLYPRADHPAGTMRATWDWDSSTFLGQIPEAAHTYNVVGNINEYGLIIGETTFGGLEELDGHGHGHLIDYGSLIWITLQRAKNAREAIHTIDALCQQFGYASSGESFAIADPKEVWLMEIMSKGNETGIVWVASRVPDGYVTSTANQARTRTFNHSDPDNVLFAADVVTFAQARGLYPKDAPAEDFSFSDIYDPITFFSARLGEARVWSMLNPISGFSLNDHLDYVQGRNLSNRMPLMVKATRALSVLDVMSYMRTHNEYTWFDNTGAHGRPDVGAESGFSPYRSRPLTWSWDKNQYVNERTVGTQQSGWAFVAQARPNLPAPIAALMWFAPDDASTSPRIPVYGGVTALPPAFADQRGQVPGAGVPYGSLADAYNMKLDSAFWVWNLVGNMFQGHHNSHLLPILLETINEYQTKLLNKTMFAEKEFQRIYATNPTEALEFITNFVVNTGNTMFQDWLQFWMFLFSRVRDGGIISAPSKPTCSDSQTQGCTARPIPAVSELGYSPDWYARIAKESGQHYLIPPNTFSSSDEKSKASPSEVQLAHYEKRKLRVMEGKLSPSNNA